MKLHLNLSLMEHYERHCPDADHRLNCLIPPPPNYKVLEHPCICCSLWVGAVESCRVWDIEFTIHLPVCYDGDGSRDISSLLLDCLTCEVRIVNGFLKSFVVKVVNQYAYSRQLDPSYNQCILAFWGTKSLLIWMFGRCHTTVLTCPCLQGINHNPKFGAVLLELILLILCAHWGGSRCLSSGQQAEMQYGKRMCPTHSSRLRNQISIGWW